MKRTVSLLCLATVLTALTLMVFPALGAVSCPNCGSTDTETWINDHFYCMDYVRDPDTFRSFEEHQCLSCGHYWSTEVNPNHDASSTWVVQSQSEATCTTGGRTVYVCPGCEGMAPGGSRTVTTAALGHDWVQISRTEPTCTVNGSIRYRCTRCNETRTETLKAPGHKYQETKTEATCTVDGKTVRKCSVCGDTKTEILKAPGHDYAEVRTEPTCTEDGSIVRTCSRCKDVQTEVLPATGHSLGEPLRVEPTCTEEGSISGTCTVCGEKAQEALPALGHDFPETWTTEQEPTVMKEGLESRSCSRCGTREERTVPKLPVPGWFLPAVIAGAAAVAAGAAAMIVHARKKRLPSLALKQLPERLIMTALADNEENKALLDYFKSHRYIDLTYCEETEAAAIGEAVADGEEELILLDVDADNSLDAVTEKMSAISEAYEDAAFALVVRRELVGENRKALDALKKEGTITEWISSDCPLEEALTRIALPLFKNEINVDNGVEAIGTVADLLGIPFISTITTAYIEGKNIKEIIEDGDTSATGVSGVVGSIATILGMDTVAGVAGLVDDLDTIKDAADRKSGVNEGSDALDAGADIVDVISGLME